MASNVRKLGINNIREKLGTKKKIDEHHHQDSLDSGGGLSPSEPYPTSAPPQIGGVQKSFSSSSIPGSMMRRSLGQISDQGSSATIGTNPDSQHMDQDTVLALTQDVKTFSEYLAKLHNTVHNRNEVGESLRVTAHERLGEVLCILKTILKKYPPVNSTDLLTATGVLISKIKGCNYHDVDYDMSGLYEAIDQLALSFSSSVSEFLMGDMETSFAVSVPLASVQQSLEGSLSSAEMRNMEQPRELMSAAKMDAQLLQMDSGVELALDRAKAWSKYAKDVIIYIEKRTQLESEFARGLSKLAHGTRPVIMENSFLPFQSIFGTALDQDKDFANTSQAACNLIQSQKFVEPLSQRRAEHEKARKLLRDEWNKEVKKMNDAITNLKKAKLLYYQRCVEYEKAKEIASKLENDALGSSTGLSALKQLEKKKKTTDDAFVKANEAETTYKSCVIDANTRQHELEKTKGIILSQVRELITLCERTMKAATIAYFQLQHTVSAPAPVQYQTLCENCRGYEPGMQYSEFVRRLPPDDTVLHDTFSFEPYSNKQDDQKHRKSSGMTLLDSPAVAAGKLKPTSGVGGDKAGSESESLSSGNKSGDNSPQASPYSAKKLESMSASHQSSSSLLSADGYQLYKSQSTKDADMRQAGHSFKKLRTPSRCRVCDTYVYFNSMECEQCHTACHKKCLSSLTLPCGSSQTERRMTTFGVSFDDHIQSMNVEVPTIVCKCIAEIDKRGLDITGLYRVSGVKSKVERLCQSFESGGDVDLSEHHPNVISNVLKLYLRQLPEPLMTVRLYPEFVEVAREQSSQKLSPEAVITKLKSIVDKLPRANYQTAATIIHHLKRVSDYESENQMNPSNLGIVFGPTLLRSSEGPVNLDSLIDTAHQTRAVELLIINSTTLFGPDTVKLTRQTTEIIEEEEPGSDNESVSSESSSNRINSIDSNLADEIMTALNKPGQSIQDSDEHLESIHEHSIMTRSSNKATSDGISLDDSDDSDDSEFESTPDNSKSSLNPPLTGSDGNKLSIYHTQVMRSSSMPFSKPLLSPPTSDANANRLSTSSVEKSASVEFKIVPRMGKQPLVLPPNSSEIDIECKPTPIRTNPNISLTQSNPIFYSPAAGRGSYGSSTPVRSQSTRAPSSKDSYRLPDIGAPDITNEIMRNERRMSGTFVAPHKTSSSSTSMSSSSHELKLSMPPALEGGSSPRSSAKNVFYTHSMKKKSTEPKFV